MASSPFTHPLHWIYENFKKDTSKMLIVTGTVGWILSSAAQVLAVVFNPKISNDKKGFLVPQEMFDAGVNIATFAGITLLTKKTISKLVSTGKIVPTEVREYLKRNKNLYQDKIGKFDFDLDEVLKKDKVNFPTESYYKYKNYITTVGTVGASIFSTNVVTPIVCNVMASNVQKRYIENKDKINSVKPYTPSSGSLKI